MSNNINVSEGTGKTVATEDLGGVQYQKIKVVGGQPGSTSVMSVNPDGSISVSVLGSISAQIAGNASVISIQQGSIAAVIIGGSVAASFTPPANQSVSGTIIANQGTSPWIITGSVQASVTPAANQSVSGAVTVAGSVLLGSSDASVIGVIKGSVAAAQSGTWSTSVMTNVITSIATAGQVMGSVAALQATNPWTVATNTASVLTIPTSSTITVLQAASIAGTYAEDAAHTTGDRGLFHLNVRNDQMASVTSADGDYSPLTVGPVGEVVTANAPITKWVQGTASMLGGVPLTGGSVAVIAAQGASIFTYITAIQVVNAGATAQWLKFEGATSSTVGFTIAPAGGGSNIVLPNAYKTNANGAFTASISGSGSGASVYISAQGFISKV
jgi:hypothetical protein